MVYHSIVHHVAKEYFENAEISQRVDFASIVAPVVIHFVKSKEGSHVAVKCVSYSNAKQRKAIIKLLKGELVNVCREEYGHLMVVRLLDVTDDTVLLQKSVLSVRSFSLLFLLLIILIYYFNIYYFKFIV